jgi:hypothetical protein
MNAPLSFKFYANDNGEVCAALVDIVDLKYLCHHGINKNTKIFKELLETLNEIDNEEEENY